GGLAGRGVGGGGGVVGGGVRRGRGGRGAVLMGGEFSQDVAAQVRQRLGLDRPLPAQYASWVLAAARGDLGRSFKTGDPVLTLILDRLRPPPPPARGAPLPPPLVAGPPRGLAALPRGPPCDTPRASV